MKASLPGRFRSFFRRSLLNAGGLGISLLQAMLITVMALPQGLMGPGLRAQSDAAATTPPAVTAGESEVRMEEMEAYYSALQEMQEYVPRGEFDPLTVVEKVGGAPADLRNWVAEQISWIPYRGQLRSASAVMMDGAGNSLDRAVLLAHLLQLAGHKPRLAMAEVSEAWVREELMPQAGVGEFRRPVLPQELEIPEGIEDPAQRGLINRYITSRQELLMNSLGRAESQLPVFASRLAEQEAQAALFDLPRTHWWVELEEEGLRLDPSDSPVLDAVKHFLPTEIPVEYKQQIEVRVLVGQLKAGAYAEQVALSHSIPAAEVGNAHFHLGFLPEEMSIRFDRFLEDPAGSMAKLKQDAASAESWVPYVQFGEEVVMQKGFTATGEVNEDHKSTAQGAALREASGILGGLGGGGNANAGKGRLREVRVEFLRTGPGGAREVFQRVVYAGEAVPEARELSEREKTERGLAFASVTDVLIQTSALRRDYLTTLSIDHELGNRSAMLGALHYMNTQDGDKLQQSVEKLKAFPEALYEFALTRFMLNPHQEQLMLGRPSLIAYQQMMSLNEEEKVRVTEGFDLIDTVVDVLPGAENPQLKRLEQGLVDATLEAVMAEGPERHTVSASGMLEKIPASEWVWIDGETELETVAAGVSDAVRTQLREALQNGNALFVPKNLGELSASELAWWEMSAGSGKLVGRIAHGGWGGTGTEYLINLYVAKAAIVLLAVSSAMCAEKPSFGCIACNFASAALIVAGIFAGPPGAVLAVVVGNMVVNLGCAIFT